VNWIPLDRVLVFLETDLFFLFTGLGFFGWLFYKIFLRDISTQRHLDQQRRFLRFIGFSVTTVILYFSFEVCRGVESWPVIAAYCALFALFFEALLIIQLAQIYLYLYLFFNNLKKGVPRLVANMFTLIFATIVVCFIFSYVFGFKIAPLLATSAVFTVILGLALQDTLGHLFSGLSLQFEKPFSIGDWIEVHHGAQKWVGQIQEINWRSTLLIGFSDELIVIPNKVVAQSEIVVFSNSYRPARCNRGFRLPFSAPIDAVRQILLEVAADTEHVLKDPPPRVLVTETNESWMTVKIFFSLDDYGIHYRVGDHIITKTIHRLRESGIELAVPISEILLSQKYKQSSVIED